MVVPRPFASRLAAADRAIDPEGDGRIFTFGPHEDRCLWTRSGLEPVLMLRPETLWLQGGPTTGGRRSRLRGVMWRRGRRVGWSKPYRRSVYTIVHTCSGINQTKTAPTVVYGHTSCDHHSAIQPCDEPSPVDVPVCKNTTFLTVACEGTKWTYQYPTMCCR